MEFFGLSVVINFGRLGIGDTIGQVKPGYQVGIPLMQVDGTGVYLEKGNTAFHRFHQ